MGRWIVGGIPSVLLIIFTNFILWLNDGPSLYRVEIYPMTFIITNIILFCIQSVTCSTLHISHILMLGIYCFLTILLIFANEPLSGFYGISVYVTVIIFIYLIYCFMEYKKKLLKR